MPPCPSRLRPPAIVASGVLAFIGIILPSTCATFPAPSLPHHNWWGLLLVPMPPGGGGSESSSIAAHRRYYLTVTGMASSGSPASYQFCPSPSPPSYPRMPPWADVFRHTITSAYSSFGKIGSCSSVISTISN